MSEKKPDTEHKHEVRIHIDNKPYDSPDPTTGEALYLLGKVAEGLVLFRDVHGNEEDAEIPNGPETIDLQPGEHFHIGPREKKEITIIVNGRQKVVTKKHLSFDEIVALAFDLVPIGPNILFTITYRHGPHPNSEGTLTEGGSVKIQDGMVFNVTATDKS